MFSTVDVCIHLLTNIKLLSWAVMVTVYLISQNYRLRDLYAFYRLKLNNQINAFVNSR